MHVSFLIDHHFMTKKKSPTFEAVLENLEQITHRLESGDLPLNEALNEFEKGIQLARLGQQQLEQAEQRVQILLSDEHDTTLTTFTKDEE